MVAAQDRLVDEETGVRLLYSFLTADKRKAYCFYKALSAEVIRAVARRVDIPADVIIPVSGPEPELFAEHPEVAEWLATVMQSRH